MHRFLLCTAFVALAAMAFAAGPAAAWGSGGGSGIRGFIGFLDYRRSLDRDDHHSDALDRRREYVFHRMSAREAYDELHGGGTHHRVAHPGHGQWESRAHSVTATYRRGGGHHNHAWGVHASDHGHH